MSLTVYISMHLLNGTKTGFIVDCLPDHALASQDKDWIILDCLHKQTLAQSDKDWMCLNCTGINPPTRKQLNMLQLHCHKLAQEEKDWTCFSCVSMNSHKKKQEDKRSNMFQLHKHKLLQEEKDCTCCGMEPYPLALCHLVLSPPVLFGERHTNHGPPGAVVRWHAWHRVRPVLGRPGVLCCLQRHGFQWRALPRSRSVWTGGLTLNFYNNNSNVTVECLPRVAKRWTNVM